MEKRGREKKSGWGGWGIHKGGGRWGGEGGRRECSREKKEEAGNLFFSSPLPNPHSFLIPVPPLLSRLSPLTRAPFPLWPRIGITDSIVAEEEEEEGETKRTSFGGGGTQKRRKRDDEGGRRKGGRATRSSGMGEWGRKKASFSSLHPLPPFLPFVICFPPPCPSLHTTLHRLCRRRPPVRLLLGTLVRIP